MFFQERRRGRTELSNVDRVATRGGLATIIGITAADAWRCERVIEPSELDHMMTMGELAIMVPKPLNIRGGVLILILGVERKARGGGGLRTLPSSRVFSCRYFAGRLGASLNSCFVIYFGGIHSLHSTVEPLTVAETHISYLNILRTRSLTEIGPLTVPHFESPVVLLLVALACAKKFNIKIKSLRLLWERTYVNVTDSLTLSES